MIQFKIKDTFCTSHVYLVRRKENRSILLYKVHNKLHTNHGKPNIGTLSTNHNQISSPINNIEWL